jgi:hypothetical protein
MGTFTTKLKLGGPAYVVRGAIDFSIDVMTVGQIRVIETLPSARSWASEVCYKEEYMCVETGVGGGNVYTYGKNIFATEEEAKVGVKILEIAARKRREARDKQRAEEAERQRLQDMRTLERLKRQYELSEAK